MDIIRCPVLPFVCPIRPVPINVPNSPASDQSGVINRSWRIFATGLSFVLFGLGAIVLGIVFTVLVYPLPLNRHRKQVWARVSVQRLLWLYVRLMRGLGLLTFRFSGDFKPPADGNGCLVIANHPTLLDVVFIISAFPDINCIVKSALWRNPLTFAIVTMAGYLRNDTDNLIEVAAEQIRNGQMLVVFPEGTRTVDSTALDFKRGAARIAVAAQSPLLPIRVRCEPPTLRKYQQWYDVPPTRTHFDLHAMPSLAIDQIVDTSRRSSIQVRHLTRWLQDFYQQLINDDKLYP